jgi:hypothetical protein
MRKMSLRIRYLFLTVPLMVIITIGMVNAEGYTIGVSKGDTFTYSHTYFWDSNRANATYPEEYAGINNTAWIKRTITDISNGLIGTEITIHFKNGTESSEAQTMDWTKEDNITHYSITLPVIIPANLNVNDKIANIENALIINKTVTIGYSDGVRETNIVNYTTVYPTIYLNGLPVNTTIYFVTYYDKVTGVPVESYSDMVQTGGFNERQTDTFKLTESSIWAVPEFPSITIVLVLAIGAVVSAVAYKKRSLKEGRF